MELVQVTCWLVRSSEAGGTGLCTVRLWSLPQLLSVLSQFDDTAMGYVIPHEILGVTLRLSPRYLGTWNGDIFVFVLRRFPCSA